MLQRSILLSIFLAFGLTSSLANATDNNRFKTYVSLLGGTSFYDVEDLPDGMDNEIAGSVRLGLGVQFPLNYDSGLRVGIEGFYNPEVTYKYESHDMYNYSKFYLDTTISGAYANVALDFFISYPVHPYVSGGLGFAHIDIDTAQRINNGSKHDIGGRDTTNFAFHVGAGGIWDITDNISLDLSLRYADYGEAIDGAGNNVRSFDMLAGFKIAF